MWVDDVTSDPRVGPSAAAFAAIQTRSVLAVPLFKADRFAAMLYLHHPNPHRWDPSEVALARDVVEQTWQAVERARAEAELRELNKTLEQRIADAIAERDASEAARREADALYRAYFKHAPEALFIVAVTADGRFVVEEVNPAHEAGVGFPIDQIRGKSLDEVLPADAFAKVALAYHRVLETGETYHYREAFNLHGVAQHWETSIVPVRDKSGRISRLFGASRDVTRQVMADETLRQAQKMEAIGQLTGGVAHDFNNLLTPILGSLDMLKRRGLGGEREQRLVLNALQSAERARTLVQRLLAFARRQPLQPAAVDVAQLVDSLAELLASTIGPQIKLSVEAPNGLPPARADANQLEMALLNIVVNARDAMPEGGMIRITVSDDVVTSAHREELSPGHYIHLSVADTGSGMDDATLARAVEPFFSTKGIGRGTGLGLSMVHGLASQLGGQLTIKSKPGLGTNVELWLPAIEEGAVADTLVDPPQHQVPAAKGRVLLVDDDDAVRRTAADMLEELGYLVEEASSGEEALQLIDDGLRPDLVVTDHLMSGMTGIQLIRGLVARGLDMPTLLVSGYAELEGADTEVSRLSKPFRPDELADKLATMASKAKPLSPDLTDAN
jgi:PAS domain S-box-containing protein